MRALHFPSRCQRIRSFCLLRVAFCRPCFQFFVSALGEVEDGPGRSRTSKSCAEAASATSKPRLLQWAAGPHICIACLLLFSHLTCNPARSLACTDFVIMERLEGFCSTCESAMCTWTSKGPTSSALGLEHPDLYSVEPASVALQVVRALGVGPRLRMDKLKRVRSST